MLLTTGPEKFRQLHFASKKSARPSVNGSSKSRGTGGKEQAKKM